MAVVSSPCVRLCAIDPVTRLCGGCGRTLGEIANWLRYNEAERRRIMNELPGRLTSLQRREHDAVRP